MKNLLKVLKLDKIDNYIFEKTLTGGKMSLACIYKNDKGQRIVIKFLFYPHNQFEIDRFQQEIESLNRLNKANIDYVPKLITNKQKSKNFDVYYFIMEYVDGITLDDYISQNPLPWGERKSTEMIYKIAVSLSNNLISGISHRDIHKKNIIITDQNAKITNDDPGIRIIDFGISEEWWHKMIAKSELDEKFRHFGAVSSWSPEYLKFPNNVTYSHDIWGLGVLYYTFLTDINPFESKSFGEYYNKVTSGNFNKLALYNRYIDLLIIHIIKRCFTVDPKKRILTGGFTKMCSDFLRGISSKLLNDEDLKKLYLQNDGDVWICPGCLQTVVPNGAICPGCGYRGQDYISIV